MRKVDKKAKASRPRKTPLWKAKATRPRKTPLRKAKAGRPWKTPIRKVDSSTVDSKAKASGFW